MYEKKTIDELVILTEMVLTQCTKNTNDVKSLLKALSVLTTQDATLQQIETRLPETIDPIINVDNIHAASINTIDNSIESHDIIINRRIELHKDLGSYIEVKDVVEFPTITPLSKLNKKEQDMLYNDIFKKALFYVNNILQMEKSDELYKSEVTTEADRLLNVWMLSHK